MSTVLLFALMLTATSMTSFGQATTPDKYPRTVTDLRLTAQNRNNFDDDILHSQDRRNIPVSALRGGNSSGLL
jgi:hypothetical protein